MKAVEESLTGYTKLCSCLWLFWDAHRRIWHSQSWLPVGSFALHSLALLCVCPAQVDTTPGRALCYPMDLTGPRKLLVEAAVGIWVFLQKMNTPDSEQASRAGGSRQVPRAGPGRCITVHCSDALQVIPKYSTHLHLSCSKAARAPLPERFVEPPWVVRSQLEQFRILGWLTKWAWAVPRSPCFSCDFT